MLDAACFFDRDESVGRHIIDDGAHGLHIAPAHHRVDGAYHPVFAACSALGRAVSHAHLRYLNPFARGLGPLIEGFDTVLVPELNLGQLRLLLRAQFLVDAVGVLRERGNQFARLSLFGGPLCVNRFIDAPFSDTRTGR